MSTLQAAGMSSTTSASVSGSSTLGSTVSATTAAADKAAKPDDHPEEVWYALVVVLALATFVNVVYLSWVTYRRHRARKGRLDSSTSRAPNATGRLSLRRIPQAVLSVSRIFSFRMRIPGLELTMMELLITVLYIMGCLVWCWAPGIDGTPYPGNLVYKRWADRTGKLAAIQLPLIVLLAMKNNAITWLVGISHEKLNLMHRVISRCILVVIWLHVVGMYYRAPEKLLTDYWKKVGVAGAIAYTLTTLLSFQWVRRRFYEAFYVSHIVLVLIALVCIHIHVAGKDYDAYVWGVWAIWIFDRLFRAGRYLLFNFILRPEDAKARVEVVGGDGLRITLRRRVPGGWRGGQHVFVAFPALGLESHPFTISNVYDPDRAKESGSGEVEMVLVIRAMDGLTRELMSRALPTGKYELPAMFDGPYGNPEDLRPFSTCVFIAGGTGVTYTIARMHQLLRDVRARDACAQRVVFVWAIRTHTEYDWLAADLAKIASEAPPSVSLAIDVHITDSSREDLPVLEKEKGEEEFGDVEKGGAVSVSPTNSAPPLVKPEAAHFTSPSVSRSASTSGATTPVTGSATGGRDAFERVRRRYGRPDLYRILEEEITASQGAVAVDVSGPDGLVADVRSALCAPFAGARAALRGAPTVMLSVEQFRL